MFLWLPVQKFRSTDGSESLASPPNDSPTQPTTVVFAPAACPVIATVPNVAWKTLVKPCNNGKSFICRNEDCLTLTTSFKQHAEPHGRLHNRLCVKCGKPITPKCFSSLLPIEYCRYVRNCDDYGISGDDAFPRCGNVVCGECSVPKNKRGRKQRSFPGFNGK